MDTQVAEHANHEAAIVWVDRRHAYVARSREGNSIVTEVDRDAAPQAEYLRRVVHEAADCERVVIMGPDAARIGFEREYVALYRRPDRLIDVGVSFSPERADLFTQLRFIQHLPGDHCA